MPVPLAKGVSIDPPAEDLSIPLHPRYIISLHPRYVSLHPRYISLHPRYISLHPRVPQCSHGLYICSPTLEIRTKASGQGQVNTPG